MKFTTNYEFDSTPNKDTIVAQRTNSSVKIRRDATYARKLASFNTNTQTYSVPEVSVVFRKDVANVDGNPSGQRLSGAVTWRLPVMTAGSDLDELIADIRAYVNSSDLKGDLLKVALPSCCGDEA